jgi:hypothetical protein
MPTDNIFTPKIIGLIITILVPVGTALYALGVLQNRIKTLETDVKDLKIRLYDLSLEFKVDLYARRAQEERKGISKVGEESK